MKASLAIISVLLLTTISARSFDPDSPPKKTLSWTVTYLSKRIFPEVDFKDSTLKEASEIIQKQVPLEYSVMIDVSRMKDAGAQRFDYKRSDVTLLELVTQMAQQSGADLLIAAARVILAPSAKR